MKTNCYCTNEKCRKTTSHVIKKDGAIICEECGSKKYYKSNFNHFNRIVSNSSLEDNLIKDTIIVTNNVSDVSDIS